MKYLFCILFIFTPLYAHDMPDRFIGQSAHKIWDHIHTHISSFFDPNEDRPPEASHESPHILTPFQKLFRQTVTFTQNTHNTLTHIAETICHEVKEQFYSAEQAADQFIAYIEDAGADSIKEILVQTLDVDLDLLIPSLDTIQWYIQQLEQTIPRLKKTEVRFQLKDLVDYLKTVQKHAQHIQKAGIVQLASQYASSSFSDTQTPLIHSFKKVYNAYPSVIRKINDLHIPKAGAIAHNAFNNSSELVEQILILHASTGTIGPVLIDKPLLYPLESLKNQIRKLGNAIEFVTSTQPVIVVPPPTTTDALMEILKTYVWRDGFTLQKKARKKIERLMTGMSPLKKQAKILSKRLKTFHKHIVQFTSRLHTRFITKLKEAPLYAIPIAPKILLDLLEEEIELLKSKLVIIMHSSLVFIYRISETTMICAQLLDYINQGMGATDEKAFIHQDIIRGIGFVATDSVAFRTIIINATEALKAYNPLPFRHEYLDTLELL